MTVVLVVTAVVAFVALIVAASSIHILKQYERAVRFRPGRVGGVLSGPA
jgi:regulator of protease activity HflC (stomatin/prohibitin superfamily)